MAVDFECKCGFKLFAADKHGGMMAECPQCKELVAVPERESADGLPQSAPSQVALENQVSEQSDELPDVDVAVAPQSKAEAVECCASCGEELGEGEGVACIACHTLHHVDCWNDAGGCSVPTCECGPASRKKIMRKDTESKRMMKCPYCAQRIAADSKRCRYCGEFTDRSRRKPGSDQPSVKVRTSHKAGVALICGLCFAVLVPLHNMSLMNSFLVFPFVAIGLGLWALRDLRREQGRMVGLWTAGSAIAIGVIDVLAWVVSLFT